MDTIDQLFIQQNSPDGGFLQSDEWKNFQQAAGRTIYHLEKIGFWSNVVEHSLPLVGKYFYVPRGPIMSESYSHEQHALYELVGLGKKQKVGWIRIDPKSEEQMEKIKAGLDFLLVKAPHDMQPREIFVVDISSSYEEVMAKMKQKTRYNIRLAQKRGVTIRKIKHSDLEFEKYLEEFLRINRIMAKRQGITTHPDEYYQKMFEVIPENMLSLYAAEHGGQVVAVNIVAFFALTATYLHGASDDKYKNIMAPYLLQWQAMLDAKELGCIFYDLGGVATKESSSTSKWEGITKFKRGFAENAQPIEYPGSYDIVLDGARYFAYSKLQKINGLIRKIIH